MSKATNQALKAVRMTRSFRGEDFGVPNHCRSSVGAYAKKVTTRAARRLSKVLSKEVD